MIKIKLNKNISQHKSGTIISLSTDQDGNIENSFWARRLKDSAIDNCIEIIKENKKSSKNKDES